MTVDNAGVQIVEPEQHRALAFIDACGKSHYEPPETEVMAWLKDPSPRPGQVTFAWEEAAARAVLPALKTFSAAMGARSTAPAETTVEHLVRLAWLERGSDGLRLTRLGRALLHAAELDESEASLVDVVVLGKDDPLAYPLLFGQLAAAGPGLLVDPYLRVEQVHQLVSSTQLTRLLVSASKNHGAAVAAIGVYLESTTLSRSIEVRKSSDLHDRVLIGDDLTVSTIGTSLNGVGRKTTVLTPLPHAAAAALSAQYENIWRAADPVGATQLVDTSVADDGERVAEVAS